MLKGLWLSAWLAFAAEAAQAKDTLNVGEAPSVSGGPCFIARDKGYFDKVGIEVHTKTFDDGALAVPALISGELDVSIVTMPAGLFNSIAKGALMVMFLDRGSNDLNRGGAAINDVQWVTGIGQPGLVKMLGRDLVDDVLVRFAMAIMYAAREFNAVAADPDQHPDTSALLVKVAAAGKPELLKSFASHWTSTSEDGMLSVPAVMKMQDF